MNARAAPRFCRATFETGVLNALAAPVNQAFLDGAAIWMKCRSNAALHATAVFFVSLKRRCKIKCAESGFQNQVSQRSHPHVQELREDSLILRIRPIGPTADKSSMSPRYRSRALALKRLYPPPHCRIARPTRRRGTLGCCAKQEGTATALRGVQLHCRQIQKCRRAARSASSPSP